MNFETDRDFCSTTTGTPLPTPMTTPTQSVTDGTPSHAAFPPVITVPCAGWTFLIRHQVSGLVITLREGILTLEHETRSKGWGGCHWACVENDGWFGFRNIVSGTYIGHNGKGEFIADAKHHGGHEFFVTKPHPEGGYWLLTLHNWKCMNMAIMAEQTPSKLVVSADRGAAWEFLSVETSVAQD
ncbi:Uu.00g112140.m01.CDS01 [Anthostomella pinea]|uniref:Uu.00g112140.m01.CDS01 n=1 Tax=Anthostomella pinea TaxID=933095 RepID=A0AAI8VFX8_9PEZI|nr:Uu.00g112140.m01.CDS01 [Anthostomella pinea]